MEHKKEISIDTFKGEEWKSYFSGRWSVLSASYWGTVYSKRPFSKLIDSYAQQSMLLVDENSGTTGYFKESEISAFSNELAQKMTEDGELISFVCNGLIEKADAFLSFVDEHEDKDISYDRYLEYTKMLDGYYPFHIQNKYAPDGLAADVLEKHLPLFEKARVHAEPVFMRSEEFVRALGVIHAEKTGISSEYLLSMVSTEFHAYLQDGVLPEQSLLENRKHATALATIGENTEAFTGEEYLLYKELVTKKQESNVVKGKTAYPGKVEGTVRVVFDPSRATDFKEGEILVAKMTRPDYLHLMKKSAAFVTDGGGVLSHAAIVARELKKPCVIGTQVATQQLKDGDRVEVDADSGIVRKL